MKPFDFIVVIISIILGLSISEFTIYTARIIRDQDLITFYLPHTIWTASGFLLVTTYFFNLYHLRNIERWSFNSFSLILLTTVLLVVNVYLLLPVNSGDDLYDLNAILINTLEISNQHNTDFYIDAP